MCHLWECSLTDEKVDGHIYVREMLIPHTTVVIVFFGGATKNFKVNVWSALLDPSPTRQV